MQILWRRRYGRVVDLKLPNLLLLLVLVLESKSPYLWSITGHIWLEQFIASH